MLNRDRKHLVVGESPREKKIKTDGNILENKRRTVKEMSRA